MQASMEKTMRKKKDHHSKIAIDVVIIIYTT